MIAFEATIPKGFNTGRNLDRQKTLAHMENGNVVLNELPIYEEQLARCQRRRLVLNNERDN